MSWTDIILEGFCVCRDRKECPKRTVGKGKEVSKPVTAKLIPEYWCLVNGCKSFMYCNAEEGLYLHINRYYKEGNNANKDRRKASGRG